MAGKVFISKAVDTTVGLIMLAVLIGVTGVIVADPNASALAVLALGFVDVLFTILIIWNLFDDM